MNVLFFKALLYISSYIPLMIMIYLNAMEHFSFEEMKKVYSLNPPFWIILLVFIFLSSIALITWLRLMKKESKSRGKKYRLTKLSSHDGEVMNYFISYLIPILSLDLTSNPSIVMNLIFLNCNIKLATQKNSVFIADYLSYLTLSDFS